MKEGSNGHPKIKEAKRQKTYMKKTKNTEEILAEDGYLYPFKIDNKKYKLKLRGKNGVIFYSVVYNKKESIETKTSPDFTTDERKRKLFCRNIFEAIGIKDKKKKTKVKQILLKNVLTKIQKEDMLNTQSENSLSNGQRGKRGQRKQQQEKQQIRKIHGSGGIYQDLVIEPIGDYRYLYNYDGKKGISIVNFDPDTKIPTIEIEGDIFYFTSDPLKKCLFRTPSEGSIKKYINGDYPSKTNKELYAGLVNYFKILYDVPGEFYYHIISLGVLQSWVSDLLYAVFYLCFSARFGAGKTAFLEGTSIVSRHGFLSGNISASSVARITNKYKLTLFADELDVKAGSKDNELYLVFRQGYKINNPYVRQKETSRGYTEEIIDVFGVKGYSVHGKAETALTGRGVDIPLRISTDKTLPILNMYKEQIGFSLFEDLFFWYMENAIMLKNNTIATKATWNVSTVNTKETSSTGEKSKLLPVLPSLPGFLPKKDCVCNISEIRKQLFKEYTKNFKKNELEILKKFMGRNEELLFVALSVCKIFDINILNELEYTFKQKVQNEGDDNIFINMFKDFLRETYRENYDNTDLILKGGDFDGCFYYEKSKAYRGFRQKLKQEDFYPVDSDKFEEYLLSMNFNKGVNVKKENFKINNEKKSRLALIFDDDVMTALELEKPKDLTDFLKPSQQEKIKDIKKIIEENPEENYELVEKKYNFEIINSLINRGFISEVILGKKLQWIGG